MGGGASGVGSGIVMGVAVALLGQQFGVVDLATLTGVEYLVFFALLGAIVFGLIGRSLGRSPSPAGVRAWSPEPEPQPEMDEDETGSGR